MTDFAQTFRIRSNTHDHVVYVVQLKDTGEFSCQCPASTYKRLCWHVKAAIAMRDMNLVSAE